MENQKNQQKPHTGKYKDIAITLCLLVLILLTGKTVYNALSSNLMAEYTTEMYTLINVKNSYTDLFLPTDYENTERAYNYFYPLLDDRSENGVNIHVNEDLSITFTGDNAGTGCNILLGDVILPEGEYILSDGVKDLECGYIYLWSSTNNPKEGNATDHVKINDKYSTHLLYLHINDGASIGDKPVTIYPMIRPADVKKDTYMPMALIHKPEFYKDDTYEDPDRDFIRVRKIRIDKEKYNSLPSSDKQYLQNYIEHTAPSDGYAWVTIDFADGTGMQFIDCNPHEAITGKIDAWGRII